MPHLTDTTPVALQSVRIDLANRHLLTTSVPPVPSDAVVVAVHGDVDGVDCPWLHDRLVAHLKTTRHLVVDLSEVRYFGAAGLTVLVVVRETALLEGCRLCVIARTRLVRLPMMVTGLVDVFDLHADLVDALVCRKLPAPSRLVGPRDPGDLR